MRPCTCDKSKKGEVWDDTNPPKDGCYLCWLFYNDLEFEKEWGAPEVLVGSHKIILENHQCAGDMLIITATLNAFALHHPEYAFKLKCSFLEVFENNPHLYNFPDSEAERTIVLQQPSMYEQAHRDVRYINVFTEFLNDQLSTNTKSTTLHPLIYLSEKELLKPKIIQDNYVVINSGYKDECMGPLKNWGYDNWKKVCEYIQSLGYKVVQVGEEGVHKLLPNVIDMRGKTSIRELFLLTFHATFGCGHESFLHHIAAAFKIPFVCVASGLYSKTWASYVTEQYISRHSTLSCCMVGGCGLQDKTKCAVPSKVGDEEVAGCLSTITVDEVTRAIDQWFVPNGILHADVVKERKKRPGLIQMGINYAGAKLKYWLSGSEQTSDEVVTKRLNICQTCVHYNKDSVSCNECGCFLIEKIKMKSMHCPLGKWDSKVIVSMFFGDIGFELAKYTHPAITAYANKIGADVFTLNNREFFGEDICYEKFQLYNILERYDRAMWIDGDALISPDCPDLFSYVPKNKIGVYDESINHDINFINNELGTVCNQLGIKTIKAPPYYNCGIMVVSKEHRDLFQKPRIVRSLWPEQTSVNIGMRGYDIHLLPKSFNLMDRTNTQNGYIRHFSDRTLETRIEQMRTVLGVK